MQKNSQKLPYSVPVLVFLLTTLIFQLILYLAIYELQAYQLDMFIASTLLTGGAMVGFFIGFTGSILYLLVFFSLAIVSFIFVPEQMSAFAYIALVAVPFLTITAAFAKQTRAEEVEQFQRIQAQQAEYQIVDTITELDTKQSLTDLMIKQAYLAKRYEQYTFSMAMIRLEFIETSRNLLGKAKYEQLLKDIATILKAEIRIEDYKFSIEDGIFVLILPLTTKPAFQVVDQRLKQRIEELTVIDRNHKPFTPTLKTGVIEYATENFEDFQKLETILLHLQKQTEVDIRAEY